MIRKDTHISFDWALKRLLRKKANFDILEGFLTELLGKDLTIVEILESESNQQQKENKFNKVDILCKGNAEELFLIELQYDYEMDYFQRMLFGTSKLIADYMSLGEKYEKVRKVYSVNIVYFDLGQGRDYIYHGTTQFVGKHLNDVLQVNDKQRKYFNVEQVGDIYPEYYLLKVNNFNDVATDRLDEWIFYLKNNALPAKFHAKGLDKVQEQLNHDQMDEQERIDYQSYMKSVSIGQGVFDSGVVEGKEIAEKKLIPLLEEERRQKEEAKKREEEERRQKEEAEKREKAAMKELEDLKKQLEKLKKGKKD